MEPLPATEISAGNWFCPYKHLETSIILWFTQPYLIVDDIYFVYVHTEHRRLLVEIQITKIITSLRLCCSTLLKSMPLGGFR